MIHAHAEAERSIKSAAEPMNKNGKSALGGFYRNNHRCFIL